MADEVVEHGSDRGARRLPALILFLGFLVSGSLYVVLAGFERDRIEAEFDALAEQRTRMVISETARQEVLLDAVRRFFLASEVVEADEYVRFLDGVEVSIPSLVALNWIPKVDPRQRVEFERRMGPQGKAPAGFWERDSAGHLIPAQVRPVHYPVFHDFSRQGETDVAGFDLASVPARREYIELAMRRGKLTITPQVPLLFSDPGGMSGYLAFVPFVSPEGSGHEARGVFSAVFSTEALLRTSMIVPDPLLRYVELKDLAVQGGRRTRIVLDPAGPQPRDEVSGYTSKKRFAWGGRIWELTFASSRSFDALYGRDDPLYGLLIGLLASFLIAIYVARRASVRRTIREHERERTRRLEIRQRRLLGLHRDGASADLTSALGDLCSAAAACLEADRASAWLVSGPGRRMTCRAVADREAERARPGGSWDLESSPAYAASLWAGSHIAIEDAAQDALAGSMPASGGPGREIVSRLDIPVRRSGALAGLLSIGTRVRRSWTAEEISLATSLAEVFGARMEEHERREAEAALRESRRMLQRGEERLRLTIDQAPIGIASLSRDGRFARVNRALATVLGARAETLIGTSLLESVVDRDRIAVGSLLARLATGEDSSKDLEFSIRREGDEAIIAARFAVVREPDGAAGEIVAQFEDVTERARAERTLRESEARYRGIFSGAADALLVVGSDGKVRDANPSALRLFAGGPAEWKGISLGRLVAGSHRGELEAAVAAVRAGRSFQGELRAVRVDGVQFPADAWITPFQHEGESAMLVSFRDISERHAVDEERKRFLAQEYEARQQAEEAVRARDTFLSVASHELRTPLTVLQLNLQGLLRILEQEAGDHPGGARLLQFAQASTRQSERLNHFLDVLLDTTRIASGNFGLKREAADLARIAREVVERLGETLRRARCEVEVEADSPVTGNWDRFRLDQVVTNLLTNAARYGYGKPIRVRALERDGEAILEVQDQGIGISEADRDRIFRKYERVAAGPHRGGLGLGLYIVREIVEAHGGRVEVESNPGEGSLFRVRLPGRTEGVGPRSGAGGSRLEERAEISASGEIRSVLVVEDDGDIRMLLVDLLEDAGYRVAEARDGREALEILESGKSLPDVVILDLMMPVMDGIEFRKAQLRNRTWAEIPVVLISADQRAMERCGGLTFAAFLPKPVGAKELLAALTRILHK